MSICNTNGLTGLMLTAALATFGAAPAVAGGDGENFQATGSGLIRSMVAIPGAASSRQTMAARSAGLAGTAS